MSTIAEEDNAIGPNENEGKGNDEVTEICRWVISRNIGQNALDDLLQILRRRLLPHLPKSAKTLLRTGAAAYNIQPMAAANGTMEEFVYFRIARGLEACVLEGLHVNNGVSIQVNVDGVKLFNSSTKQFLPVLCKVFCNPDIYQLFIVALYSEDAKPLNPEEFLHDFIEEVNHLLKESLLMADNMK